MELLQDLCYWYTKVIANYNKNSLANLYFAIIFLNNYQPEFGMVAIQI